MELIKWHYENTEYDLEKSSTISSTIKGKKLNTAASQVSIAIQRECMRGPWPTHSFQKISMTMDCQVR